MLNTVLDRYDLPTEQPGYSDWTACKQQIFREFAWMWVKIAKGILSRKPGYHPLFHYFDLTAGKGHDQDGNPGSPLIFTEQARRAGISYRAFLFEHNPESAHELTKALQSRGRKDEWSSHIILPMDSAEGIFNLAIPHAKDKESRLGLIYFDPNGDTVYPTDSIRFLTQTPCFEKIDFLAHISANSKKRFNGAVRKGVLSERHLRRTLLEDLQGIGKEYIWLREPATAWQWTFALCTNWDKSLDLRKMRFHGIDTPEGARLLDWLELTREEFKDKHGTIPGLPASLREEEPQLTLFRSK